MNLQESIRQDLLKFEGFQEEVKEEGSMTSGEDSEYFRAQDAVNMHSVKQKLESVIAELEAVTEWRGKHSHRFFSNGDSAGTGDLYNIANKLKEIDENWDKETELYGM